MQFPLGSCNDDGHAFLQVQQRAAGMHTAIDAAGETFAAAILQQPSNQTNSTSTDTTSTTSATVFSTTTTLVPCAITNTTTTTSTSLGQIHPAEILRSQDSSKPLTEAERALVGVPIVNGSTLTSTTTGMLATDAWGAATQVPPSPPSSTMQPPFEARLTPMQVINEYQRVGPGVNCVMGEWSEWSDCRAWEGDGLNQESRTRRRDVSRGPSRGGNACDVTMQQEVCSSVQTETYERVLPSEQED